MTPKIQTQLKTLIKTLLLSLLLLSSLARAEIKITYYVPDASGSPIAATDEQGKVIWRKHYRPYGAEISPGPDSRHNHIGYTGHVQDSSTDLIYMGARYYNPIIGRTNGIDPAPVNPADPRTFNRYAYAHNSPYNYVDPDGRVPALYELLHGGVKKPPGFGLIDAGYGARGLRNPDSLTTRQFGSYVKNSASGAEKSSNVAKSVTPNPAQLKNINRFQKKIPANAKENIQTHQLPNDGVAVQATSPGRVPGSKAVYEKQIDAAGKTTQYTKTTYDPQGNIVHVKDKINGGVFP